MSAEQNSASLRAALAAALEAQPEINPTSLARAIGRGDTYIRDFMRGKKETLGAREIALLEQQLNIVLDVTGTGITSAPEVVGPPLLTSKVDGPLHYKPPPQIFEEAETLPLYSSAEGGDGALIIDHDPITHIARPYMLRNISNAYAVLITGESMIPAFRPGQRAWVNPRLPWMKNEEHIFRSENNLTGEWKALIKELADWDENIWLVRQHNPPREYQLLRREWQTCHRVVGRINRE